jgi:hypothetical protein
MLNSPDIVPAIIVRRRWSSRMVMTVEAASPSARQSPSSTGPNGYEQRSLREIHRRPHARMDAATQPYIPLKTRSDARDSGTVALRTDT